MSRKAPSVSKIDRRPSSASINDSASQPKPGAWHPDNASGFTPVFSAERHIGTALRETYRAFARAVSQNLAPLGLTLSMWFALRSLWEVDGLSQAELGRRTELNPAAVVAVLNALEAAGLVERRRTRKDRRIYNVFLTAAGRKLRTKATALALQVDARALRGTSHTEIEQALATLTRLRGNLAYLNPDK